MFRKRCQEPIAGTARQGAAHYWFLTPFSLLTLCFANTLVAADDSPEDVKGAQFFADKIEPLLKAYCLDCHSHAADVMEGGLTLDSRSGWLEGGGRGTAIVPGKPEDSLLIKAVRHEDPDLKMPPDEKLTSANGVRIVRMAIFTSMNGLPPTMKRPERPIRSVRNSREKSSPDHKKLC